MNEEHGPQSVNNGGRQRVNRSPQQIFKRKTEKYYV